VSRPRLRRLAFAACAVACLAIAPAAAEQSGGGGVVVRFKATLAPSLLPRQGAAPVTLTLSGGVRGDEGTTPPRLSRIELAFASQGRLDASGLPTCPRSRLRNATRRQALARCREALVGRGTILAEVPLAAERPISARAAALAFNGMEAGHRVVWVHAYSASPPISFVLPFSVRMLRHGPFGLLLDAPIARTLGRWPRLRAFRITLGRRYRSHGSRHSYLAARCPLPPRLNSLTVPLARATYRFDPAPTHAITILRACRASG